MDSYLPSMVQSDGIGKSTQNTFGGYNHTEGACDGEIFDMKNLTGDLYPVLAPRTPRYLLRTLQKPNGMFARDGLFWVDGTNLYYEGTLVGQVEDSVKTFVGIGDYVVIMPDKKYYNINTAEFGNIEKKWLGNVKFSDGTIWGEPAEGCTILSQDMPFPFKAGDAVQITCDDMPGNSGTIIIREVSDDGMSLVFYENSFEVSDASVPTSISRNMPDIEFITQSGNRLWGCAKDTIYASSLGDIFNWNVFDGISTDSYAVNVGSPGNFTGCTSYLGYPCFFKEQNIYKIYGEKPSNFQVMESATMGVDSGAGTSLAVAGETLFYMSRGGVVSYTGSLPKCVSGPFGTDRYSLGVSGSDGKKYYISAMDKDGKYSILVFNTSLGMWHKEDSRRVISFAYDGTMYMLDADGGMYIISGLCDIPEHAASETVESVCEFGSFVASNPNHKGCAKIQLRCEVDAGSMLTVYIKFAEDLSWTEVKTLMPQSKKSFYLPIIPRRGDWFKIKLCGIGSWKVYSLTREFYIGSELR